MTQKELQKTLSESVTIEGIQIETQEDGTIYFKGFYGGGRRKKEIFNLLRQCKKQVIKTYISLNTKRNVVHLDKYDGRIWSIYKTTQTYLWTEQNRVGYMSGIRVK